LEHSPECRSRLERIDGYLELHIEQGPVLEAEGVRAAAVTGCVGVERRRLRFLGRVSHAGTTPMDARRDAGLAASATALRVEEIARAEAGVGTVGAVEFEPGIATAVPGEASMLVDLRNAVGDGLARMLGAVREAAADQAQRRGCELVDEPVWAIEPIAFDEDLVAMARAACEEIAGTGYELPSGALHDAASMATRVPTAMVFSPSIGGISHSPEEDTSDEDLAVAIEAYGAFANRAATAS
jgi:hydantoinase/carbamoylase family amidase